MSGTTARQFRTALAVCGSAGFLFASIVVASRARHYQISNQPMPNGKGGFMTPNDGCVIAAVLLLFAVAWPFLSLRGIWREKQA